MNLIYYNTFSLYIDDNHCIIHTNIEFTGLAIIRVMIIQEFAMHLWGPVVNENKVLSNCEALRYMWNNKKTKNILHYVKLTNPYIYI